MTMESVITVIDYIPRYQSSIRKILTKIGWAEHYIASAEQNMQDFALNKENYGVYLAIMEDAAVAFLYVQY